MRRRREDDREAAALRGRVAAVGGNAGRAVFSAGAGADKVTAPKANKKAIPAQQQKQVASSSSSSMAVAQKKDTENPWLNAGVSASTSAKRKDRNPSKSKQRAMELAEDARVDLLDEDLLDSGDVSKATTTSATATTSRGKAKATDDSGPSSSRGIAFTQRDLVAEAFAGDDVTIPTEPVAQRLLHCEAASVAERQNMLALSFRLDFRRSSIVSRFGFPRYCMLHTYAAAGTGSSDSQTSRLHT
ncbi:hypothetical protein A4X09_0g5652 [Tilletia walkeri]|uniref:Uncharacterized protein n=1 Tax=Tilletia walkeri TaxID=117179 RepID=A0A8X7N5E2_9BASI|nr:hypothetical protein A4X09_0g5652 [Tilletia walkeri]